MTISVASTNKPNVVHEKVHEYAVAISYQGFSAIVERFDKDESFDVMQSFEKFKVPLNEKP